MCAVFAGLSVAAMLFALLIVEMNNMLHRRDHRRQVRHWPVLLVGMSIAAVFFALASGHGGG